MSRRRTIDPTHSDEGRKRLLAQTGSVALFQVITSAVLAVNMVLVARVAGAETTGIIAFATGSAAILTMLACLGTGASYRLLVVKGSAVPLTAYVGVSILVVALNGLAMALLAFGVLGGRGPALTVAAVGYAMCSAGARQAADANNAWARNVFSAAALAMGSLIQLLALALGLIFIGKSPVVVLVAYSSGPVFQICCSGLLLSGSAMRSQRCSASAESTRAPVTALFSAGWPAYVSDLGIATTQRLDRLIALPLLGASNAGLFAVATTCAEASRVFTAAAAQSTFLHAATSGLRAAVEHVRNAALLVQVAVLLVAVLGGVRLVPVVFGSEFESIERLVLILLLAEVGMTVLTLGLAHLSGIGLRNPVVVLGVAAACLAVLSYPLGAASYGLWGLAWSKVGVFTTMALLVSLTSKRFGPWRDPQGARPG